MRKTNPIQEFIFEKLQEGYLDRELASKIGIPLPNFNGIKNGRFIPSTILFARICVEFNLSKSKIFELISYLSEMHRNREIIQRGVKNAKSV